jgi:hypothetical protein
MARSRAESLTSQLWMPTYPTSAPEATHRPLPGDPTHPGEHKPMLCTASRTDGTPCKKQAIHGGTVCDTHGGSAPQVRKAANRRLAELRLATAMESIEVELIDNPIEALQEIVSEARAFKRLLAARLAAADPDQNSEGGRALLKAYERSLDRVSDMLGVWIRLGLDAQTLQPKGDRVGSGAAGGDGHEAVRIFHERMSQMSERNQAAALLRGPADDVLDAELVEDQVDDTTLIPSVPAEVPVLPVEPPQRPAAPTPRLDYIDGASNPRHADLIARGGWDGKGNG